MHPQFNPTAKERLEQGQQLLSWHVVKNKVQHLPRFPGQRHDEGVQILCSKPGYEVHRGFWITQDEVLPVCQRCQAKHDYIPKSKREEQ